MADHWEMEDVKTIYFWGGIFSNWAKFSFKAPLRQGSTPIEFNCAEQYMMATKAELFGDDDALAFIMEANNPSTQKAAGRRIVGYSDEVWNPVARDMSYVGIYEKFRQNDKIRDLIVSTGNKLLVEASPMDRRWGIGFDHLDAVGQEDEWGWNWLGQILMKVRDDIRSGTHSSFETIDWKKYETKSWRLFQKWNIDVTEGLAKDVDKRNIVPVIL